MVRLKQNKEISSKEDSNDNRRSRLSGNFLNLFISFIVIFVAINVSDAGFANSIDKITKNIDVALQELKDDMPVYTNYTENEVYRSRKDFNPKGMSGLYNLTMKFINFVLEPNFLKKGLISFDSRNQPRFNPNVTIPELLKDYWALVTLILIIVLLTVLLPLCGMFFCCCRCCGRCGARSRPCDKKRDLCKKVIHGTLLIALCTALLFCVVCAFASNQQMEEGITELPDKLKIVKEDTNAYLESTKKQADHLLGKNYEEFKTVFQSTINKSGENVMKQLVIWSNATAMTDLNSFVKKLPSIKESLNTLKVDTNTLRASASQLNDAMRKVKKDLQNTLNTCTLPQCESIKGNISRLQTNIDFNKLPDVSPTINKLTELNVEEMQQAANEGINKLLKIENDIKVRLDETLGEANVRVEDAGKTIKDNLNNVTKVITTFQTDVNKRADPTLDDVKTYIRSYQHFRYYGGLAISCILLLIAICITLGLTCGICGKRPDGYSDNCCNKGAGGQFLICAVMIMFMFSLIIGVVTLAMLLTGIAADRTVCYPLRHPENSTLVDLIDDYISRNLRQNDLRIDLKRTLILCYQNESLYNVFNLESKFNVDDLAGKFDVSVHLEKMQSLLDNLHLKDYTILSEENERTLKRLSTFEPSIDFDRFQDELKENFINLSLEDVVNELKRLLETINDMKGYESIASDVRMSILHIQAYKEKILIPMNETAKKVITIAQKLEADLKMNRSSFSEAINQLISEITDAQFVIQNNGTKMLQTAAKAFGDIIQSQINSYLYRVVNVTKNDLGQCGPLNLVINSTLTATCDKIILPWNGFWVTAFLSMLLFIPTIIVSVKLATLYQKYKQCGPYVETEYLYDAYADRGDNIPLNSRGKRGGAKPKKKGKKYEDRPHMGGEVLSREYAAGSHPPDARYADMAPKHWEEFPNGGPPQYQRAPTEYERPPPYYYPGAGDH